MFSSNSARKVPQEIKKFTEKHCTEKRSQMQFCLLTHILVLPAS